MRALFLAALLWSAPTLALSQTVEDVVLNRLVGTHNVKANQKSERGVPIGCGLEFTQAVRDFSARQGGLVSLDVSIEIHILRQPSLGIFWTLKVVPRDVTFDRDMRPIFITFNPVYAYVRSLKYSSVQRERSIEHCERGGLCLAFSDDVPPILEALLSQSFFVSILRHNRAFDLHSSVDLSGHQARSEQDALRGCIRRLTDYWGSERTR